MKHILTLLNTLFLMLLPGISLAQSPEWRYIRNTTFVTEVAEAYGRIWLSTEHGVVMVDKSDLSVSWKLPSNSEVPREHIQSVAVSPTGDPWIGTYDVVLMRWDGSAFQEEVIPADIRQTLDSLGGLLYDLKFAPNGDLWLGTSVGAIRKSGDYWKLITSVDFETDPNVTFGAVWGVAFDQEQHVNLLSNKLVRLDADDNFENVWGGGFAQFSYGGGLSHSYGNKTYFITDVGDVTLYDGTQLVTEGTLWELGVMASVSGMRFNKAPLDGEPVLFTPSQGAYRFSGGTITPFSQDLVDAPDHYWIDAEGTEWAVKKDHLYKRSSGGTVQTVGFCNQIADNRIIGIEELPDGRVLVVPTLGPQVSQQSLPTPLSFYDYNTDTWTIEQGPAGVGNIQKDSQGRIWISAADGIYRLDNNQWVNISEQTNQPAELTYRHNFTVGGDHIWVAFNYKLYHFDGTSWSILTPQNSGLFAQGYIQRILAMPDGSCYVQQYDYFGDEAYHLHHFAADGSFSSVQLLETWGTFYLTSMATAPDGTLWAGDFGNLYRFDGTNLTVIDSTQGWQAYSFDIDAQADGSIYAATATKGVLKYSPEGVMQLSPDNSGLSQAEVGNVMFDSHGTIWAGYFEQGVDAYNPAGFQPNQTRDISVAGRPLHVWPNPTTDDATASFELDAPAMDAVLRITDITGKVWYSAPCGSLAAGRHRLALPVQHLPAGTYSVAIMSAHKLQTALLMRL